MSDCVFFWSILGWWFSALLRNDLKDSLCTDTSRKRATRCRLWSGRNWYFFIFCKLIICVRRRGIICNYDDISFTIMTILSILSQVIFSTWYRNDLIRFIDIVNKIGNIYSEMIFLDLYLSIMYRLKMFFERKHLYIYVQMKFVSK